MKEHNLTRRYFLGTLAAGAAGAALIENVARAQDLPRLDESDPAAKALLYVHDVAQLDKSNPMAARYQAGQSCANCAQIQGDAAAEWRPCGIFPGKLVNAKGWCSVWAAKP